MEKEKIATEPPENKTAEQSSEKEKNKKPEVVNFIGNSKTASIAKEASFGELKELIEKNLKWSQIIYEQNRRISRRLFWSALLSWFKWIVIAAALIIGTWYSYPYVKDALTQYQSLVGTIQSTASSTSKFDLSGLDKIINSLNLPQQQVEQIKATVSK